MPADIPAQTSDLLMDSWEKRGYGDLSIRLDLEFDAPLDVETMRAAIESLVEAEPILISRLITDAPQPFWQPSPDATEGVLVLSDDASSFETARERPIGPQRQLEVCLLTGTPSRLTLKLAHPAGDAAALKQLGERLAAIYSSLLAGKPTPKASPGSRRDLSQVVSQLSRWRQYGAIWDLICAGFSLATHPATTLPWSPDADGDAVTLLRYVEPEQVSMLSAYGHQRGATLNDIFLAATYRAMAQESRWDGKTSLSLAFTIDLRQWYGPLDDAAMVCNLSSWEVASLGKRLGADFAETLSYVVALTRHKKAHGLGLPIAVYFHRTKRRPKVDAGKDVHSLTKAWSRAGIPPAFINLGRLDASALAFGASTPRRATMVPSALAPPALMLGLSGYAGGLTLTARTPSSAASAVASLLDKITAELPVQVDSTPSASVAELR